MAQRPGMPTVVIVGRPNVGKSTLFNAITGTRRSIVGDEPGITRDRIRGQGRFNNRPFDVIDTGGIIPNDDELIPSNILKQARMAFAEASQIIFVIDGRSEITGTDRELAQMLRKLGKPVTLAVNKIDVPIGNPAEALNKTFDLFVNLGATDPQLDFPTVYASGRQGWATLDLKLGRHVYSFTYEPIQKSPDPRPPVERIDSVWIRSDHRGRGLQALVHEIRVYGE